MPYCFEASLRDYLASALAQQLAAVLREGGYELILHLHEPEVSEYRRESTVVSILVGDEADNRRTLAVASDSAPVNQLVAMAARQLLSELSGELLRALPGLDPGRVQEQLATCLAQLLPDKG
jgi:hypothetical protein